MERVAMQMLALAPPESLAREKTAALVQTFSHCTGEHAIDNREGKKESVRKTDAMARGELRCLENALG